MLSGHRGLLDGVVTALAVFGVACTNAGPAPAPSAPQQQSAVAPATVSATVTPVPPNAAPSTASESTSASRPTIAPIAPVSSEDTATVQPTATAEPTATAQPVPAIEQTTSSPVPAATSSPATPTPPPPSPTPAANAPSSVIISSKIEDFKFEDLEISIGTIVSWLNKDGVQHTVTAGTFKEPQREVFDSGALSKGEQYSFVFHDAGSYKFYCVFHPRMEGTITVRGNP